MALWPLAVNVHILVLAQKICLGNFHNEVRIDAHQKNHKHELHQV